MTRVSFYGTADASAGVFHQGLVWVLNDEDQLWRAYEPSGGHPRKIESPFRDAEEADLEACVLTPEGLWACGWFSAMTEKITRMGTF